ncbi:putative ribonuclease H-like domain-containing protein [Tanacetum coccineum]
MLSLSLMRRMRVSPIGTIEEEVYVTQPPGFKDPGHPEKVYKVVKALYGLHQAPEMDKFVAEILKKFKYYDVKSASTPVIGKTFDQISCLPVCAVARFQVTPNYIKSPYAIDYVAAVVVVDKYSGFKPIAVDGYHFHDHFYPVISHLVLINFGSTAKVLDLQKAKDAQAKEIAALKKRIQRLERRKMSRPTGLKRLRKVGMSRRVESSKDQESLGAPKDASKQGRSIEDIDADVDVSLVDETQERQDDDLMFDTGVLEDDEMHVEAKVDGKDEQSTKPDDSTAGEAVTTASVDDSVEPVISVFHKRTNLQVQVSKDKGKGIMIEPEVPLKRKDQIALDEQIARDIQAKLDVEY